MTDTQDTNSRIDDDRPTPEASPSAGWRATAALMHVTAGLEECDVLGCDGDAEPVRVIDDAVDTDAVREGVRCSDHAKDFLEVSS
ncbi:hypothetical protein [Halomarina litorea]|uniref:hypothetical protein n=1 Tax=Halomarina litorea TaxID=2961595 RepID=UPI0020C20F98|nr:hypothetical protein [Halomarina sp. BCD28]